MIESDERSKVVVVVVVAEAIGRISAAVVVAPARSHH